MSSSLTGKRIVNTRAVHQAQALNDLLRALGAEPLDYPCIAILPPEDTRELDAALLDLAAGRYSWLVLTSTNTVLILAQRLAALGLSLDKGSFSIAAIGSATTQAVNELLGLTVAFIPEEYLAQSLAQTLPITPNTQVLLPESTIARPTLATILCTRGADVTVVPAYQTIKGSGGVDLPHLLATRQVEVVSFTSASTVTYFVERLHAENGSMDELNAVCIACIGPKTAETAREYGLSVSVLPENHTLEGLVKALEQHFIHTAVITGNVQ